MMESSLEDFETPIEDEYGEIIGRECGLCRLEENKQTLAKPHRFELKRKSDGREIRTWVCEKHQGLLEDREGSYLVTKRFLGSYGFA